MKVFLTGATGFVGGHLAASLAGGGDAVRALVRPAARKNGLAALGVEIVAGDVADAEAVRRAARGCDVLVHAAVPSRRGRRSAAEHRAVSVTGTANVLRAALEQSASRVVYVSTAGFLWAPRGEAAREDSPIRPHDAYQRAKAEGERVVLEHVRRNGTPAVVARLTAVYGPRDLRWLRLFRDALGGRPLTVGTGDVPYHLTYVDDVVRGLRLCAGARPAPGARYVLAGTETPTVRQLLEAVAAEGGVALRPRRMPAPPLVAAAALARRLLGPLGLEPGFVQGVKLFTAGRRYDGSRARRELGFDARVPLREGVRRTLAWYREEGLL